GEVVVGGRPIDNDTDGGRPEVDPVVVLHGVGEAVGAGEAIDGGIGDAAVRLDQGATVARLAQEHNRVRLEAHGARGGGEHRDVHGVAGVGVDGIVVGDADVHHGDGHRRRVGAGVGDVLDGVLEAVGAYEAGGGRVGDAAIAVDGGGTVTGAGHDLDAGGV